MLKPPYNMVYHNMIAWQRIEQDIDETELTKDTPHITFAGELWGVFLGILITIIML